MRFRFISILILIVLPFFLPAQKVDIFHIDSIPAQGLLLDKGWKWNIGDNAEWAATAFDDNSWQTINPSLSVHDSLPKIPKSGICWFRIHLSIDTSIQKKQLALLIQQSGASEIYLNGKFVQRFGIINADPKKTEAFDPISKPTLLPILGGTQLVLAVRFALEPGVHYTTVFGTIKNPALWITVKNAQNAMDDYSQYVSDTGWHTGLIIGIFALLVIIHFAFYFFNHGQKANFYFFLYALSFFIFNFLSLAFGIHRVGIRYFLSNIAFLLVIAGTLFLLTAIYMLLERKKDWTYWSLFILVIPALILNFWQYNWGWHVGTDLLVALIQLNIARISLQAVARKKKGAWLIAAGSICFFLFFILFTLVSYFSPLSSVLINLLFAFAFFSIPISTSLYLGLDFAFANLALKEKLIEVNELSKKNIQQEKEKQQILFAQNETLEKRVSQRTTELSKSLIELKSTQSQLIQSEKMASLGELTAGIAHEIQNPLNFVNNFSDVNTELIDEAGEEINKGNIDEVKNILNDIKENEQKINHHGKRAGDIVKGMLQHSRTSTGLKEPTDINALADEYLRLSYHGLRAKDKTFNAKMETDFDEGIGKINIIPQDIGRVLLNLYNNAFYTVNERLLQAQPDIHYEPTVSVTTKKSGNSVIITVSDNGNGIPQKIVDKIFQPFFTTKPTGSGTGLGLSLSYDIVKAHGGEIMAETKEGQGTKFIIRLPA